MHQLQADWATNPRWSSIQRPYSAKEVLKLRGSVSIEYTLAKKGAEKLWDKLQCSGAWRTHGQPGHPRNCRRLRRHLPQRLAGSS